VNPILFERLKRAQAVQAGRKYQPGDPIKARRFINVGDPGDPVLLAHPGDPGVFVSKVEGSGRGLVRVKFGEEEVECHPREIEPDWEE
jgi:hypothetical protein